MNTRLKLIRKTLNLTQNEFAMRIGLKRISIANMESGKRNITERTKKDIYREFKVNPQWFENGTDCMFTNNDESINVKAKSLISNDDEFYKNIVKMVVNLEPDEITLIKKMVQRMLNDKNSNNE